MGRSELERCEWCYLADGPALGNVILFNPAYNYAHPVSSERHLSHWSIFGFPEEQDEPEIVVYKMYDTDFGGVIGCSRQPIPHYPYEADRARLDVVCNLEWTLATKELELEQDTPPEIVYDMLLEMDRSDREWAEMFAAVKYLIRRERFTKMEVRREQSQHQRD